MTAAIHAMNHAMYNMLTPLTLTLTGYYRFTKISNISLGFTLYLACYGFFQIPAGFLSDRVERRTLLSAGLIINGVAIAAAALFPGYAVFLFCMAGAGIGASAYHPVGASYLTDLYKDARGKALGISGIGATVGLALGPILGGALCRAVEWRATFLIFATAAILMGIAFRTFAIEPVREKHDRSKDGGGWDRGIVIFLIAAAAIFTFREFCGWGGYYLLPMFTEKTYHFDVRAAGVITGMQSIGGFVAQPLGGYLSDRVGRRWLMIILLLFVAIFITLIPHAGRGLLVPTVIMYSFVYTATVPIIDALIADRTPPSIRGGVFGIFMAAGIGMSAFCPLVLSRVLDAHHSSYIGFVTGFTMLGVSVLISMTLLLLFRNAEKPAPAT